MVLAVILTTAARFYGRIDVLDPFKLNTDKWLACSEWEFKNLIIQAAAQAFTNNNRLLNQKWAASVVVLISFLLGAVCLAVWVLRMTANA
jgi:hypothetical protein